MSADPIACPSCKERFGGVAIYDRHFNRREDRCKTPRELYRLGFHRDALSVWHREQIAAQAPLVDKCRIPRTAQRTRRGSARRRAEPQRGQSGQNGMFGAPRGSGG